MKKRQLLFVFSHKSTLVERGVSYRYLSAPSLLLNYNTLLVCRVVELMLATIGFFGFISVIHFHPLDYPYII